MRYLTRIIFNFVFMTSRSTALLMIRTTDATKIQFSSEQGFRVARKIGCANGSSKTQRSGLSAVNVKPPEAIIWDRDQLERLVNFQKDIEEYLRVAGRFRQKTGLLCLCVNHYGRSSDTFFKPTNLGKNATGTSVRDACAALEISGTGVRKHMTTRRLRGPVISMLFESDHADSSLAERSGHIDTHPLKYYQKLRVSLDRI